MQTGRETCPLSLAGRIEAAHWTPLHGSISNWVFSKCCRVSEQNTPNCTEGGCGCFMLSVVRAAWNIWQVPFKSIFINTTMYVRCTAHVWAGYVVYMCNKIFLEQYWSKEQWWVGRAPKHILIIGFSLEYKKKKKLLQCTPWNACVFCIKMFNFFLEIYVIVLCLICWWLAVSSARSYWWPLRLVSREILWYFRVS